MVATILYTPPLSSDEKIENRQPELHRSVHPRWNVRVEADVTHHGFDVLVAALKRVVEEDRPAAACLEQAVNCLDGQLRRPAGVVPQGGLALRRKGFARSTRFHHLVRVML